GRGDAPHAGAPAAPAPRRRGARRGARAARDHAAPPAQAAGGGSVSGITTHVLDTSVGRPARGVAVRLEGRMADRGWVTLAGRVTDDDGRVRDLVPAGSRVDAGVYRLTFETGAYFQAEGRHGFFPEAAVTFELKDGAEKVHVPLLVSPFGYSTYRGS